jgi:L-gulono-1,4-lactone dehydrogenase
VRRAEAEGTTVRAVGAGHSWSDAALTDGYLVLPDRLGGIVDVDGRLVRVLGGTHLRDFNAALDARGLALPQMGGYDEQTIAGVVSTSTHGSGLNWGPFPDFVRSLELVVAGGEVVRVERDDPRFDAAVCGMGTLGLIHSLVIEVREKFWLHEVRTVDTWERVRETVTPAGVLGEGDHYELFVNPYAGKDGEHRLVVTRRSECPEPAGEPKDKLERHPLTELESKLPITGVLLRFAARHWPALLAWRFDAVLADMADDAYDNVSYKVFNIGEANRLPAVSMELGVTLEGDRHLETVDRILAIAARRRKDENLVHTSPIALRFVAPSRACASMMQGQPTMMIELILVDGTRGGDALLAGYEEGLADLGVRPHWGQINALTPARVRELYPRWEEWLAVEREFNATGVFDSPFTRRVDI